MRIPDVNLLVYARSASSPDHTTATDWLEGALSHAEPVGFAMVVLLGFVRLTSNSRVFADPLSVTEALDQVEEWLAQPSAILVDPGRRHVEIWRQLLESSGTGGNLTTDAHLAALAIEHAATLGSFDGDMHRFAGLKLEYLR